MQLQKEFSYQIEEYQNTTELKNKLEAYTNFISVNKTDLENFDPEDFIFYENIRNFKDLGNMFYNFSEMKLKGNEDCFDFELYGKKIEMEITGDFTTNGYCQYIGR